MHRPKYLNNVSIKRDMTNEEKKIHTLRGKKEPFLVPEGYFEGFNQRLADRIPFKPTPAVREVRLIPRLWRYAAAVLLVASFGIALYFHQSDNLIAQTDNETAQEEYFDETLDYIMVNNMDIVEYLSGAY